MKVERNTKQRQVLLDELRKLKTHPTASELHAVVRQKLPRISLGTVYRNLELLASRGEIQKLEIASGEARFDGDICRHYHIRCLECGKVGDVHEFPGDLSSLDVEQLGEYRIVGYWLEFKGVCPKCQRKTEMDHCGMDSQE